MKQYDLTILAEAALIVVPEISVWNGRALDRQITAEVEDMKGMTSGIGSYRKSLLPASESLKAVQGQAHKMRAFVAQNTLPWETKGQRLISVRKYEDFMDEWKRMTEEYKALIEVFMETYLDDITMSAPLLGDAFNMNDYPHPTELPGLFRVKMGHVNLPVKAFDHSALSEAQVAEIREEEKSSVMEAVNQSMVNLLLKLYDRFKLFRRWTTAEKAARKDSIDMTAELLEWAASMNYVNDARVDKLIADMQELILPGDQYKERAAEVQEKVTAAETGCEALLRSYGFSF